MKCLQVLVFLGLRLISMSVAIRASDPLLFAASSPSSSSSSSSSPVLARSSPTTVINSGRTSRFSNAGIHQVPAPNLARPGATPPPPPPQILLRRYQQTEIPSSGFKPILPTTKPSRTSRRGNSRSTSESTDSDIITIDNIDKYQPKVTSGSTNKPGDSFLRSVTSTLQVKRTDESNSREPKRGKVFDDVIYEDHGDQFKPSESRSNLRFTSYPSYTSPQQQQQQQFISSNSFNAGNHLMAAPSNTYRIYTNTDGIAWRRVRS